MTLRHTSRGSDIILTHALHPQRGSLWNEEEELTAVANPGFPRGGRRLQSGGSTYYRGKMLADNWKWKKKEIWPIGGRIPSPLAPTNGQCTFAGPLEFKYWCRLWYTATCAVWELCISMLALLSDSFPCYLSTLQNVKYKSEFLWILYSRGRVWVHHLRLSSCHCRSGDWQWLT